MQEQEREEKGAGFGSRKKGRWALDERRREESRGRSEREMRSVSVAEVLCPVCKLFFRLFVRVCVCVCGCTALKK